jgi:hypothetical protein
MNKQTDKEIANDKSNRIMNGIAVWCSYYRANPHRFCKDFLNIDLKLFQKILLFMMNYSTNFMYLASRGQGKTFLVSIFCVVRCILYPETRICVTSKTRPQGAEVVDKIVTILMPKSANLRMEIKEVINNQTNSRITFRNGSVITVITANESARHNRSNIIVIDEFRMVDLNIINTVIRKFNTAPRQPKYLNKPEYSNLKERNKEIYMSSCWLKSHWSFDKVKAYCTNLLDDNKKYFICGLPYELAIKENLLDAEQVADEMSETDFNEIGFSMEMECLWFGDNEGSLFKYEDLIKDRTLESAFYPKSVTDKINDKRLKIPQRQIGERRILSADIAVMASKRTNNDATSIFINQLVPTGDQKFISNIIYTENVEGMHTEDQSLLIRKLFDEYDCTDIVLDSKGVGFGVTDLLLRDQYDASTGRTYKALSCCNNPDIAYRCKSRDAEKVIWSIQATADFNSKCTLSLREGFRQGKIRLLIPESDCEDILRNIKGYNSLTASDKLKLQLPYIHTTLLINELINLEYDEKGNVIKVHEKSGMRKDRFSSLQYNYYVACQLEAKLYKPQSDSTSFSFKFRQPKIMTL